MPNPNRRMPNTDRRGTVHDRWDEDGEGLHTEYGSSINRHAAVATRYFYSLSLFRTTLLQPCLQ
jgi:hypothetical protein